MLTNFSNVDQFPNFNPFSKFWQIFQIFGHLQNFGPFSKFLPIFRILAHFKILTNFGPFSKFWPLWPHFYPCIHSKSDSVCGVCLQNFAEKVCKSQRKDFASKVRIKITRIWCQFVDNIVCFNVFVGILVPLKPPWTPWCPHDPWYVIVDHCQSSWVIMSHIWPNCSE